MKLPILFFLLLFLIVFLSGCIEQFVTFGCGLASDKDKDHCFQFSAVNTNNPGLCEKIEGKGFVGSNPPKDKCYLQLANKTNNPDHCTKMKGGMWSYEPDECYDLIASNTKNPDVCKSLTDADQKKCLSAFKLPANYFETKKTTEKQKEQVSDTEVTEKTTKNIPVSDTKSPTINKSQTQDNPKQKPTPVDPIDLGLMPSKPNEISENTKSLLANMPDKSKKEIKDMALVNNAHLASQPKIPEPPKDNKDQPGFFSKAWNWLGWGAQKTSDALGDETPSTIQTVGTGKQIYDYGADIVDVKSSIDGVNDKINSGKIDNNRGKLIKVGYGLGKGVKWIASKVPIVGDPLATVADESIKTGMKFGEKLAEHTTKTDKCIEDPLSDDCID